jgi:hypothetical protein
VSQQIQTQPHAAISVGYDQPLIGVPGHENGRDVVRYFASEADADAALSDDAVQDALNLAGAWSDLDWDETIDALDRIRHESVPTPPIDLDA